MANYKKGKSKRKGSSCLLCKPHKANGVKKRNFTRGGASVHGFHDLSGPWKQEAQSLLNEEEQREEEGV
tara:strand:+ start:290 stop:496 length:207 start_codon:yes stop_codon:yes gene_type:complete